MLDGVRGAHRREDQTVEHHPLPDELPSQSDVQDVLCRVLQADGFAGSEKLSAFLTYIVGQVLEGRADRIKGYTVAVEALGHGPDHDPQADPTVRVLAGRLRQALALYFSGPGRSEPLRIVVPKGAYVPEFVLAGSADRSGAQVGTTPYPGQDISLSRTGLNDREADLVGARTSVFDKIATMSAHLTAASSALVAKCEPEGVRVLGSYGMAAEKYAADFTFRGCLDPSQPIHVIEDVAAHPGLADHPIQTVRPSVRSLIVVRVPTGGPPCSALVIADPSADLDITIRQGTLLCELAALAAAEIETVDLLAAA